MLRFNIFLMTSFLTSFVFLFAFWLLCSGYFDAFHLSLGILSSALIAAWTGRLFFQRKVSMYRRFREHFSLYPYFVWLLYEIVLANIQVLKLAFSKDIQAQINPQIVEVKTSLKRDVSKFIFANSITLTPGTITIREENGRFLVHALNPQLASGLGGKMLSKVALIFGEKH